MLGWATLRGLIDGWQVMRQNTRVAAHRRNSSEPDSGARDPCYERPALDSRLLEEFFDARIALARVCPETALMFAVIEDAILCYREKLTAQSRVAGRALNAEAWLFSTDSGGLFSFSSICWALGLDPGYIRKKLRCWCASYLDLALAKR